MTYYVDIGAYEIVKKFAEKVNVPVSHFFSTLILAHKPKEKDAITKPLQRKGIALTPEAYKRLLKLRKYYDADGRQVANYIVGEFCDEVFSGAAERDEKLAEVDALEIDEKELAAVDDAEIDANG